MHRKRFRLPKLESEVFERLAESGEFSIALTLMTDYRTRRAKGQLGLKVPSPMLA